MTEPLWNWDIVPVLMYGVQGAVHVNALTDVAEDQFEMVLT